MPLSVVDVYQHLLPKTNCRDCGFPTCLAFAGMVVSEGIPLKSCPHVAPEKLAAAQAELNEQKAQGKWTRRDPAADALEWARQRAASMQIADLPGRIGGRLVKTDGRESLELPYFQDMLIIRSDAISKQSAEPLNRWEQVFIYNHLAQGGQKKPTGRWKGLVELPNTVSKIKSMQAHVEKPLVECFRGNSDGLRRAGEAVGGQTPPLDDSGADVALQFQPLPRVPVLLLFWDEAREEGYDAEVKLLFDETVTEHLDIESIIFLSERIRHLLCGIQRQIVP
jgi:hypothetical protein